MCAGLIFGLLAGASALTPVDADPLLLGDPALPPAGSLLVLRLFLSFSVPMCVFCLSVCRSHGLAHQGQDCGALVAGRASARLSAHCFLGETRMIAGYDTHQNCLYTIVDFIWYHLHTHGLYACAC